tara:strand:- start:836 stop:2005 length:1170 start_codon:yes stop_codon:yes gene_type:complete
MLSILRSKSEIDLNKYFIVKYFLESKTTLEDAAWNLAIGQSVGNPKVRNHWETDELFENHSCKIIIPNNPKILQEKSGIIEIAFPSINIDFNTDGISHLLVNIMGGQLDINDIDKCQVLDINFPDYVHKSFLGPKFGIEGIRKFTGVKDKPLFGAIVKPKTGITPQVLLEMVKELVEGGVNFIKEDEILSDPIFCPIELRVPLIMDYLKDKNVVYCVSIHADPHHILDRVKQVYELGGNGVHVNFWCGLGVYKSIRELDLPIFVHFQKSGDKILTNKNHDFHIDWRVICKLAGMMGVDFIHAGMIGGYYKWDEQEVIDSINILHEYNVMPALSCGFNSSLTQMVTDKVGNNYMANVGGAIHGHKDGTLAGALEMKKSIKDLKSYDINIT